MKEWKVSIELKIIIIINKKKSTWHSRILKKIVRKNRNTFTVLFFSFRWLTIANDNDDKEEKTEEKKSRSLLEAIGYGDDNDSGSIDHWQCCYGADTLTVLKPPCPPRLPGTHATHQHPYLREGETQYIKNKSTASPFSLPLTCVKFNNENKHIAKLYIRKPFCYQIMYKQSVVLILVKQCCHLHH